MIETHTSVNNKNERRSYFRGDTSAWMLTHIIGVDVRTKVDHKIGHARWSREV